MVIDVIKAGLLTTLQDLGRGGYRRMGVPVSGAMDIEATSLANALVGNPTHHPVLEILLMGPTLAFSSPCTVALVGASLGYESPDRSQFAFTINGTTAAMGEAFALQAGDVIRVGPAQYGARCWLAISGLPDTPSVLGSYATHVKTQMGGIGGRGLESGQRLQWLCPKTAWDHSGKRLPQGVAAYPAVDLDGNFSIPLIPGPHEAYFGDQAYAALWESVYHLSQGCDRMGYRLQGPKIQYKAGYGADILSEPNGVGVVQVPGDGQPLILLQDAGTTGGYAKVGVVPTVHLRRLAQLKPGDSLRFYPISREVAQGAYISARNELRGVLEVLSAYTRPGGKLLRVGVSGKCYQVFLEEKCES